MNDFLEQLKRVQHAVRFVPERKKAVRDYLVRMTSADVVLRAPRKEHRPFGSFFMRPMPVLAGIMGLVLVGGSTSLASQSALPGDVLYPMKVTVTEKIVEAVQFTPDAQAEYATELAARRLDEATKLTERGEIAEDIEEELTERFDEQASRARVALEMVRTKNSERAERIAAAFEDAIRERQLALGDEGDDVAPAFAAALAVPEGVVLPDGAAKAPTLMMVPVEPATAPATSSENDAAPTMMKASVEERVFGQGADERERVKRPLKTKVRNALREIREFRSEMEAKRTELRMRSQDVERDEPAGDTEGSINAGGDDDSGREDD